MPKMTLISSAALALAVSANSQAGMMMNDNVFEGLYVWGTVGAAKNGSPKTQVFRDNEANDELNAMRFGYQIGGGYNVTNIIGLEAGLYNLGLPNSEDNTKVVPLSARGAFTGITLGYPVLEDLNIFARGGAQYYDTIGDASGAGEQAFSWYAGMGAEYALNQHFGIRLDADVKPFEGKNDKDIAAYAGLGVVFHLGAPLLSNVEDVVKPTPRPTAIPMAKPMPIPTATPTPVPTAKPTIKPTPVVVKPTVAPVIAPKGSIYFATNSSGISVEGLKTAAEHIEFIRQHNIESVLLACSTDPVGNAAYNEALCVKRTQTVENTLINAGVTAVIETRNNGEANVNESLSQQALGQYRRVDFIYK